jgi:Flp pilus assembly protein TadD
MDHYRKNNKTIHFSLIAFVSLLLMGIGTSTYIRNMVWATEVSLWQDAMQKAPGRARPLLVLAFEFSKPGNPNVRNEDIALRLYEKSLGLVRVRKNVYPAILNNMAGIYSRKGEPHRALELLTEALSIDPDDTRIQFDLIQIQIMLGRWDEASQNADRLISSRAPLNNYLNIKGFILLKQRKHLDALAYFQKALKLDSHAPATYLNLGSAFSLADKYQKADWFLQRAYIVSYEKITPLMLLIENSIKAEDMHRATHYTDMLLDLYRFTSITSHLKQLHGDNLALPISPDRITPIIADRLASRLQEIDGL